MENLSLAINLEKKGRRKERRKRRTREEGKEERKNAEKKKEKKELSYEGPHADHFFVIETTVVI